MISVVLCRYDRNGTGRVNVRQLCDKIATVDNVNPAIFEGDSGTPRQRQPFTPRSRDVISHSDEPMLRGSSPAFKRYADNDPLNRTIPAAGRSMSAPRLRPASENIIHWGAGMGEPTVKPIMNAKPCVPKAEKMAPMPQLKAPSQPKVAPVCKLPPKVPLAERNTNILAMKQKPPTQFVQQSSLTSQLM